MPDALNVTETNERAAVAAGVALARQRLEEARTDYRSLLLVQGADHEAAALDVARAERSLQVLVDVLAAHDEATRAATIAFKAAQAAEADRRLADARLAAMEAMEREHACIVGMARDLLAQATERLSHPIGAYVAAQLAADTLNNRVAEYDVATRVWSYDPHLLPMLETVARYVDAITSQSR